MTRNALIILGLNQSKAPIKDICSICGQSSEIEQLFVSVQGFSTDSLRGHAHRSHFKCSIHE